MRNLRKAAATSNTVRSIKEEWTRGKKKDSFITAILSLPAQARNRIDKARGQAGANYRAALQNSGFMLSKFDAELRYTWIINPHADLDPRDMIGKRDDELHASEEMCRLKALKHQVLQTKTGVCEEIAFQCREGERIYAFQIDPLFDDKGVLIGGTAAAADISDCRKSDASIEESEERLRALMDHNPSLVFLKDENGRYMYLNKTYEKQFVRSSEWYGKTDYDFWPRESAELFIAHDAEVVASGEIQQFLEDSTDMDGTRFCWLCYKFPFTNSKGKKYIGGIGINATQRVIAEEALQAELIQNTILREIAAAVVETTDTGGLAARVLTVCGDLLGARAGSVYVADEMADVLRAVAAFGHNEEYCRLIRELQTDHELPVAISFRNDKMITHDLKEIPTNGFEGETAERTGGDRWISLPIHAEGEVCAVMELTFAGQRPFSLQEINLFETLSNQLGIGIGRAKTLLALEESEEKYRALFNSLDYGFCIIDVLFDDQETPVDWYYLETNPGFAKQSGLSNAKGRFFSELAPYIEQNWLDFYGKIAKTGIPARVEEEWKAMGAWYEVYAFRIGDMNSRKVAVMFYNTTERKRAETQIQELVEKLRRSDQNKTEFLSNLSHELRNPLASIVMSLSLLKLVSHQSEQGQHAMEIMDRQTNQLSRLVDDLLEVTRISCNKIELKREIIELNELAARTVDDHKPLFVERRLKLEVNLSGQPIQLEADPARLKQVLGNLLHNALKFTEPGGKVHVEIRQDRNQRQAIIEVIDTGIGIRRDLLPEIFQPFIQAENSLARSHGGLGLGLVIVNGIIKLHGGSVTADSEGPGQGARFTIRLPLLKEQDICQGWVVPAEEKTTRSLRILVIEDIPDVAEILCSLVRYLGHEVESAANGYVGLSKAAEMIPDVVFCDIGLPGMNGYEVAQSLRGNQQFSQSFLIALSGYAQAEDLERAKSVGFDMHLAKPVSLTALKKILTEI